MRAQIDEQAVGDIISTGLGQFVSAMSTWEQAFQAAIRSMVALSGFLPVSDDIDI